jgi:hypothetical protein
MRYSLKDRVKASIRSSKEQVFLRSDFERFGEYRQVTRVLGELEKEGFIVRAGYGVYAKPGVCTALEQTIASIKSRLGKRGTRLVTLDGTTVQLGQREKNSRNAQVELDQFKLRLAETVVRKVDLATLRKKSLANLKRWNNKGVWCSAHDEWFNLMESGNDDEVIAVMTGRDENSNRLRQSPPYTGLLDQQTVEQVRESTRA